jgi:hypothetical protein
MDTILIRIFAAETMWRCLTLSMAGTPVGRASDEPHPLRHNYFYKMELFSAFPVIMKWGRRPNRRK